LVQASVIAVVLWCTVEVWLARWLFCWLLLADTWASFPRELVKVVKRRSFLQAFLQYRLHTIVTPK
jgi:hypothetical protein